MKVIESETGSPRKKLYGGLAALALGAVFLIWNAASKEKPVVSGTPANGLAAGTGTKKSEGTGPAKGTDPEGVARKVDDLASMMKVSGRAKPPADAPSVEELVSRMPDGSPVPPYEPPVEEPVVETEAYKLLAEVERRASSDPEAAAAWVEAMPKGDLREESIAFVVAQWSKKDAAKAKEWKDRLEEEARSF